MKTTRPSNHSPGDPVGAPVTPGPQGALIRNTAFNVAGQVLPMLINFVSVPLVLANLGTPRFGILAIFAVILGASALFDLGLARAVVKFGAQAVASRDYHRICRVVGCTVWVQLAMGTVTAALLWWLAPFLTNRVFAIPPEHLVEAERAISLMGFGIPLVLVTGSYRGLLEAAQRFDLVNGFRVVCSSFVYLAPIIGVLLNWGLVGITGLIIVSRAFQLVIHWAACAWLIPGHVGLPVFHFGQLREILRFSGWVALSNAISPVQYHLERVMVASLMPVAAVSFYAVPYEVITAMCLLPSALATSIFPVVSILAEDRREKVQAMFVQSVELLIILMTMTTLGLVGGAHLVFDLWINPEFAAEAAPVAQVLAFGLLPTSMNLVCVVLFQGLARPDVVAKQQLVRLPVMASVSWLLISQFGLLGAALSWTLAQTLTSTMYCWSIRQVFNWSWRQVVSARMTSALLVLIALAAILSGILKFAGANANWWGAGWMLAGLAVQGFVSWHWLLHADEKQWVRLRWGRLTAAF